MFVSPTYLRVTALTSMTQKEIKPNWRTSNGTTNLVQSANLFNINVRAYNNRTLVTVDNERARANLARLSARAARAIRRRCCRHNTESTSPASLGTTDNPGVGILLFGFPKENMYVIVMDYFPASTGRRVRTAPGGTVS